MVRILNEQRTVQFTENRYQRALNRASYKYYDVEEVNNLITATMTAYNRYLDNVNRYIRNHPDEYVKIDPPPIIIPGLDFCSKIINHHNKYNDLTDPVAIKHFAKPGNVNIFAELSEDGLRALDMSCQKFGNAKRGRDKKISDNEMQAYITYADKDGDGVLSNKERRAADKKINRNPILERKRMREVFNEIIEGEHTLKNSYL